MKIITSMSLWVFQNPEQQNRPGPSDDDDYDKD